MTHIRQLAFGYSTKCNITCDHCIASDDTTQNVKMELSRAKEIIEEMAYYSVAGISFTAGEPLLYLKDICELVRICKEKGIFSRVVTNGYWAKNREESDRVVSELIHSGLSQLRISFSRWHQENIDRKKIINAVTSCRKYNLDYFISFITDFSGEDDSYEQFLRENRMKFFPEPLIYFGRAEKFNRPEVHTDYHPNVCTMNPYFSPELDMFACCDAGMHFSKTNFFFLGNRKDYTIDELFRKKEQHRLYHLIRTMGLTHMASFLGFKASEIVSYRKCELCEALFNSGENLSRLESSVASDLIQWKR